MYDENSNPRHLSPVSEEALAEADSELELLERQADLLRKKNGVFNSKGWEYIAQDLLALWTQGDMAIRSRRLSRIEDIEFERGKLAAIEAFLNMATITKQQYADVQQQQATLKAAVSE